MPRSSTGANAVGLSSPFLSVFCAKCLNTWSAQEMNLVNWIWTIPAAQLTRSCGGEHPSSQCELVSAGDIRTARNGSMQLKLRRVPSEPDFFAGVRCPIDRFKVLVTKPFRSSNLDLQSDPNDSRRYMLVCSAHRHRPNDTSKSTWSAMRRICQLQLARGEVPKLEVGSLQMAAGCYVQLVGSRVDTLYQW